MRRVCSIATAAAATFASSAQRLAVPSVPTTCTQSRTVWDNNAHQPESMFMDRKDLDQMYPAKKPWVVGGEYGYQRGVYWNIYVSPNPAIRMPHERRRLNPRPARVVTVFGASGYLGAAICRELLIHPEIQKVRATTRYPLSIPKGSDLEKLIEEFGDKIELHECDVTDRVQVNVAANGADTLIFAIDYFSEYSNNSHHDVFVTGGTNVAWTARNVRAERVILCSGLDSTFASESNYVDMRSRGEEAVSGNFADSTILRFGPLYGGNYRYRGLGKYLYPCHWPGTRCQPLWVTDAARCVVRCARANRAVRYKFDLGGPRVMTHLEFAQKFSNFFHTRLVFPFPKGLALFFGKLLAWTVPNPWFDDNWIITWELDQVPRSPAMFERLAGWDRIEYKPLSMEEAADVESGKTKLQPLHELDAVYKLSEDKDAADLVLEEEAAKKQYNIHRAKAEPAHGRGDGMELIAQEIYPGQQFRIRALADAKYPSQVKDPHPVSIH